MALKGAVNAIYASMTLFSSFFYIGFSSFFYISLSSFFNISFFFSFFNLGGIAASGLHGSFTSNSPIRFF